MKNLSFFVNILGDADVQSELRNTNGLFVDRPPIHNESLSYLLCLVCEISLSHWEGKGSSLSRRKNTHFLDSPPPGDGVWKDLSSYVGVWELQLKGDIPTTENGLFPCKPNMILIGF